MSAETVTYVERWSSKLVRERVNVADIRLTRPLNSPKAVAEIMASLYGDEPVELFVVFVLNVKHRIVGHEVVTRGIVDASLLHPREVYRLAILANASAIIVAHNHPSGDPTPSAEDRAVTRQIREAGKIIGIPMLDHVVVGAHGWHSIEVDG